MKKSVFSACAVLTSGLVLATPKISLDSLVQVSPNRVVVSYTLAESPALVTVSFETNFVNDAQETVWVPLARGLVKTLAGDVNRVVQPGSRTFIWKARTDWPEQRFAPGKIRANITARRLSNPPDYVVIDLEKDADAVSYYETAEEVPGGVTDDAYKTTKLLLRRIRAANVRWRMGASYDDSRWSVKGYLPAEAPRMVSLSEDYYIGVYGFTQKQYEIVAGYPLSTVPKANPSATKSLVNAAKRPVTNVDYETLRGSGVAYSWPSAGHAVDSTRCLGLLRARYGFAIDLPTCAQWEYAYRAGTATSFFTGDMYSESTSAKVLKDYAWTMGNTTDDDDGVDYSDMKKVHVVGKKLSNPWGLYDIAGNAVELCLDWAVLSDNAPSRGESVDPVGPVSRSPGASKDSVRIWRGGSCLTGGMMGEDHNCRATAAYAYEGTYGCMGFRICCPAVAK
jgi:formylglycine-generating enzyme required for sulfatase activity